MTQITVTLKDHMGSDLTVVNAARVSFGKESEWANKNDYRWGADGVLQERDTKLIRYLAKHNHISPFGHCFASFHVKAPIFVARQLVKHKFLRWNEVSRRYVDDEPEFYVPNVWRGRSANKKQGSEGVINIGKFNTEGALYEGAFGEGNLAEVFEDHRMEVLGLYDALLVAGVAPEQARMVLPQSTMTEWWWSGSLDAWASMCNLRLPSDTQYESRLVAQQVSKVMGDLFPVSWASLVTSKERSDEVPLSGSKESEEAT